MAIKKKMDIGNTGLSGEHWALCEVKQIQLGDEPGTLKIQARYGLWRDAVAKAAGLAPIRKSQRVSVVVNSTDPKFSDIEAEMDKALTVKSVQALAAVQAIEAAEAVEFKAAVETDPEKGIEAQPAVAAQDAVPGRKYRAPVVGVRGGELEGGIIV